MIKIFCPGCGSFQPFEIEPLRLDVLNELPWGDIICQECHLVISTLESERTGRVEIVFLPTAEEESEG